MGALASRPWGACLCVSVESDASGYEHGMHFECKKLTQAYPVSLSGCGVFSFFTADLGSVFDTMGLAATASWPVSQFYFDAIFPPFSFPSVFLLCPCLSLSLSLCLSYTIRNNQKTKTKKSCQTLKPFFPPSSFFNLPVLR